MGAILTHFATSHEMVRHALNPSRPGEDAIREAMPINRRENLVQLTALTALVGLAGAPGAKAAQQGSAARGLPGWASRADALTALLRGEEVSVADWRAGLGAIFDRIDLEDILADLDFEQLAKSTGFADKGVAVQNLRLGDGRRLRFFPKFFAIDRGRAIIPHGHAGMVSAHLPLSGRLHLRQYDQLAREGAQMRIRPTVDRMAGPGDLSSIGTSTDNVHWFIAEEPAHTLDLIVTGIGPADEVPYNIFNLDMDAAEPDGDALNVPILDVATALAKYG